MILDSSNGMVTITQQSESISDLVGQMNESYIKFKNDNIIVMLSGFKTVMLDDILQFLLLSTTHRSKKHSFVIVTDKFNLNDAPDELIIVPTLQEAIDIIEMEEMERDLGF
jgi:hypothetical protein